MSRPSQREVTAALRHAEAQERTGVALDLARSGRAVFVIGTHEPGSAITAEDLDEELPTAETLVVVRNGRAIQTKPTDAGLFITTVALKDGDRLALFPVQPQAIEAAPGEQGEQGERGPEATPHPVRAVRRGPDLGRGGEGARHQPTASLAAP